MSRDLGKRESLMEEPARVADVIERVAYLAPCALICATGGPEKITLSWTVMAPISD